MRSIVRLISSVMLIMATSVQFAQAKDPDFCDPIDKCKGLWIAIQPDNVSSTFFKDDRGQKLPVSSINIGSSYIAATDIYVHRSTNYKETLFRIRNGSKMRIGDLKAVSWPSGGFQAWAQIQPPITANSSVPASPAAPHKEAGSPAMPVAPPPSATATETCMTLPTSMPTKAFAIIDPPITGNAISPSDLARLMFGRPMICDQYGLIVHQTLNNADEMFRFNGGDTAQREGSYWFAVWVREHTKGLSPWPIKRKLTFDEVLQKLEPHADGIFYRHPKQAPYNNPFDSKWGTSRDQLVPLIAAMGVYGKYTELRRLWNALPEDLLGKHAFNGGWKTLDGHDGTDCGKVNQASCSPTQDCSLQEDNRACDLQVDARDCSANHDDRECSQPHDERNCGGGIIHDYWCEAQKATQNQVYAGNKASCEAQKATQNSLYGAQKAACETSKATQNAIYAEQKLTCETSKTAQNGVYATKKLLCEISKSGGKAACEARKSLETAKCLVSNHFTGDWMDPATINFFRRAMNQDPALSPDFNYLLFPLTFIPSSPVGDAILIANQPIKGYTLSGDFPNYQYNFDPDNVGDDLNNDIQLIMSSLRYPSVGTRLAIESYITSRHHSYGSYLTRYYQDYGDKSDDVTGVIKRGIAAGWQPSVKSPYGVFMWYHRPSEGANPQLATIYAPILERFLK